MTGNTGEKDSFIKPEVYPIFGIKRHGEKDKDGFKCACILHSNQERCAITFRRDPFHLVEITEEYSYPY